MLTVKLIPILDDNYTYVIQSVDDIAVIDPGTSAEVIAYCEEHGLTPTIIFNTHHHGDHIEGNAAIAQKYNAKIIGPDKDTDRIPNMSQGMNDGDVIKFGDTFFEVIETVGHTKNHLCFWFKHDKVLFSGDTLFAMGCGRCFEGAPEDMFKAFEIFNTMPEDTKIYCGHEYTVSNAKFCLSVEPENTDLIERMSKIENLRASNKPTIPSNIGIEKKTNIFMRAKNASEFAHYRTLKDNF